MGCKRKGTCNTWGFLFMGEQSSCAIERKPPSHEQYSFIANVKLLKLPGWLLMSVLTLIWISLTHSQTKLECFICSLTYSFIEWTWYTFTHQKDGVVRLVPFGHRGRPGFTSVEQFIGNLLYLPIGMHGYLELFPVEGLEPYSICMTILRISLFPINIWLLEIIQDGIMKLLLGFNPAWNYSGCKGSMFGGAINLNHWKLWIILGVLASTFDPPVGIAFVWICLLGIHGVRF